MMVYRFIQHSKHLAGKTKTDGSQTRSKKEMDREMEKIVKDGEVNCCVKQHE